MCQFRPVDGRETLADYIDVPGVYPAGRLDYDSEGLLILTDDGRFQDYLAHPRRKVAKQYLTQVEGSPSPEALTALAAGPSIGKESTRPVGVETVAPPTWLWPRTPPIRFRASIPTTWLALTLREGKNRQVRRMTAAVGYPTLRLIRVAVGDFSLDGLAPGEFREVTWGGPPADETTHRNR